MYHLQKKQEKITFEQACDWLQYASLQEIYDALNTIRNPVLERIGSGDRNHRIIVVRDPSMLEFHTSSPHVMSPGEQFHCKHCDVWLVNYSE